MHKAFLVLAAEENECAAVHPLSQSTGWMAEILWEKCCISSELALSICNSFLKELRKCPDNPAMDLDTWRHLLWAQALGDKYQNLTGEIHNEWLNIRYTLFALTPEIKLLLKTLRHNYLLGLITNGPSNAQWEKINRLDLQKYFDVIIVSGDTPWEKPHQKIFQEACRFINAEPHSCIMVGDKIETDILGGIQAKLGATVLVALSNDKNNTEIQPDYIINNLLDLPLVLSNTINKVPNFKSSAHFKKAFKGLAPSFHDLDDCNSNSSDGS